MDRFEINPTQPTSTGFTNTRLQVFRDGIADTGKSMTNFRGPFRMSVLMLVHLICAFNLLHELVPEDEIPILDWLPD